MVQYTRSITGSVGSLTTAATLTQNVNVGDSVVLTISAGTSWSTTATNCTRSPTTGFNFAPNNVTTVFFPTNGAYTLDIFGISNIPGGGSLNFYARLQGTVSGTSLDFDPDPFSFSPLPAVQLNTTCESEVVTITGLTGSPIISVAGGSYYIRNNSTSPWTGPLTSQGNISNNQQVKVAVMSSFTYETPTAVHLTINTTTRSFTVTTIANDPSPDSIPIPTKSDVELSQIVTSDTVTPVGYTIPVSVTITSLGTASFSVGGGTFSATAKTMSPGQSLAVQLTSSPSYSTSLIAYIWVNGGLYTSFTVATRAADTTPDGTLAYNPQLNAIRNTPYIATNGITISGVEIPINVSIASGNGEFSIGNQTNWTRTATTATNTNVIYVKQTAAATFSTPFTTTLNLGTRQASFTVTTEDADITPSDPLTFNPRNSVELSTPYIATNAITIAGVNTGITVNRASGSGEYSINNGATWLTGNSTVNNGSSILIKQTSSPFYNTPVTTTLNIGSRQASYTVTTRVDDIPDQFSFGTNPTGATRGQTYPSAVATISGMASGVSSSLTFTGTTGATYKKNGVSQGTAATTVVNGDTIQVEIVAASTFDTLRSGTISIGGISSTFSVRTLLEDKTPDNFANFSAQTGILVNNFAISNTQTITGINTPVDVVISGDPFIPTTAQYSINGGNYTSATTTAGFENGYTISVRFQAPSTIATTINAYLTIGTITRTFTITSEAADTTPSDPFGYNEITGAARSQLYPADAPITIAGVNTPITVSRASGAGQFSINNVDWYTTGSLTVSNTGKVYVRQTSSPLFSTPVTTTLNIGSRQASFTVRTLDADTTPDDPFGYQNREQVEINTEYLATQPILVSGINTNITVSRASGAGQFSIGNTTSWRTADISISNGALVYIKQTSSPFYNTPVTTTLNIGSRQASYTVTTAAQDNAPDQFSFGNNVTGAVLNQTYPSAVATITGINAATTVTFSGQGTYSKNGVSQGTASTTVISGDKLQLQIQAASTFSTTRSITIAIGGVSSTWEVRTLDAVSAPSQFTFIDIPSAITNADYFSNEITVSGINTAASVTFSGDGQYRKFTNGAWGAYTTVGTTTIAGDRFELKIRSASTSGTTRSGTLNIGGTQDTYTVTTAGAATDTTPDQFSFSTRSDAELNTSYPSNTITVSGISANTTISIVDGQYELNNSTNWLSTPSSIPNGTVVRVKRNSSTQYGSTVSTTLTIGGVSASFSITTKEVVASLDYGFEVYNSSGVKTLSVTSRVPRLVAAGSTTITVQPAAGTYASAPIYISDLVGSDDSWQVLIYEDSSIQIGTSFFTSIGTGVLYIIAYNQAALPGPNNTVFNIGYYVLRS